MFISKDTLPSKHLTNLSKAKIVRQANDNQQHRISASLWTQKNEKIIKGNELSALSKQLLLDFQRWCSSGAVAEEESEWTCELSRNRSMLSWVGAGGRRTRSTRTTQDISTLSLAGSSLFGARVKHPNSETRSDPVQVRVKYIWMILNEAEYEEYAGHAAASQTICTER